MIPKKCLLAIFLFATQMLMFGQPGPKLSNDFNVIVGDPYKVVDAKDKEYFSDEKGTIISVKTDGEKVTLQKYDANSMTETTRQLYKDFPPYNKVQRILKLGDKLFYIFSSFDKKNKVENVYSRQINMSDATFEEPQLLFTTTDEAIPSSFSDIQGPVVSMFNFGTPIRFEAHKSFDNSKILIRYRLKPAEKKDSENYDVLGFYVFDTKLNKQWGGEVKMPYTEKEMNNVAYGVTKDGNAYMLAYLNESKKYELWNVTSDLTIKPNTIDINGQLLFDRINLLETPDGNLKCVGFYATGYEIIMGPMGGGASAMNINGILSFTMDKNGKILTKNDFEFPIALINQYEAKKAVEKNTKREGVGKAGIRDIQLIDVYQGADGSTIVVGEQRYMQQEFKGTSVVNAIYYGDVVITKFDKFGKLTYMKKLPKTQVGYTSKGGMSIKFIKGTTASYVLFLDNVKNAKMSTTVAPEKHQDGHGGFLTAYKVDDVKGTVEKHSIFDIHDIQGTEAFQFSTPRLIAAKSNAFILEVYVKGKKDNMIKMELTK